MREALCATIRRAGEFGMIRRWSLGIVKTCFVRLKIPVMLEQSLGYVVLSILDFSMDFVLLVLLRNFALR